MRQPGPDQPQTRGRPRLPRRLARRARLRNCAPLLLRPYWEDSIPITSPPSLVDAARFWANAEDRPARPTALPSQGLPLLQHSTCALTHVLPLSSTSPAPGRKIAWAAIARRAHRGPIDSVPPTLLDDVRDRAATGAGPIDSLRRAFRLPGGNRPVRPARSRLIIAGKAWAPPPKGAGAGLTVPFGKAVSPAVLSFSGRSSLYSPGEPGREVMDGA